MVCRECVPCVGSVRYCVCAVSGCPSLRFCISKFSQEQELKLLPSSSNQLVYSFTYFYIDSHLSTSCSVPTCVWVCTTCGRHGERESSQAKGTERQGSCCK